MEEENLAALWVPRKFASGACSSHHIGGGHPVVDRHLLFGDIARVQALQVVQRYCEQNATWRGWSARFYGPLLSDGNDLHSVVHLWTGRSPHLLSQQNQFLQRHDEYHWYHRHHSLFHHTGHCHHRRRRHRRRVSDTGWTGREEQQSSHVISNLTGHPSRSSVSNIQTLSPLQGATDIGSNAQGLHARIRTFNIFPLHR